MNFNRYITASEFSLLAEFCRRQGEPIPFRKGDVFSQQGVRNRYSGVVERGAFRYVHSSDDGCRHVVGYAFSGEFVGCYVSMRNDRPSWVGIEAMSDGEVLRVNNDALEAFYRTNADHERLGRSVAEHLMGEIYERLLQSYGLSAQACYEELLGRCPDLLNLVPLHELASYLRVRPETLSRIRRRVR